MGGGYLNPIDPGSARQQHRVRPPPHLLGELPCLLVADVTGRRPDEARDRVALLELAHVEADHQVLVAEQRLGERAGELGLPDAGRAKEEKAADGSLRVAETELRLPRQIARFVLTIGATANQNGTAMFEGVTVLFLAQFFGVDLSLSQQLFVMLVCILAGVGTAGVPAGSLPVIALIMDGVGVPPEGIGLILVVDRFLDMCRTTLNVVGDLVCAQVISTLSVRDSAPSA